MMNFMGFRSSRSAKPAEEPAQQPEEAKDERAAADAAWVAQKEQELEAMMKRLSQRKRLANAVIPPDDAVPLPDEADKEEEGVAVPVPEVPKPTGPVVPVKPRPEPVARPEPTPEPTPQHYSPEPTPVTQPQPAPQRYSPEPTPQPERVVAPHPPEPVHVPPEPIPERAPPRTHHHHDPPPEPRQPLGAGNPVGPGAGRSERDLVFVGESITKADLIRYEQQEDVIAELRLEIARLQARQKAALAREDDWKRLAETQQEQLDKAQQHQQDHGDRSRVLELEREVKRKDTALNRLRIQHAFTEWMNAKLVMENKDLKALARARVEASNNMSAGADRGSAGAGYVGRAGSMMSGSGTFLEGEGSVMNSPPATSPEPPHHNNNPKKLLQQVSGSFRNILPHHKVGFSEEDEERSKTRRKGSVKSAHHGHDHDHDHDHDPNDSDHSDHVPQFKPRKSVSAMVTNSIRRGVSVIKRKEKHQPEPEPEPEPEPQPAPARSPPNAKPRPGKAAAPRGVRKAQSRADMGRNKQIGRALQTPGLQALQENPRGKRPVSLKISGEPIVLEEDVPVAKTYEQYVEDMEEAPVDLPPIKSNIVVAVRCRPLSKREFEEKHMDVVRISEGRKTTVEVRRATGAELDYLAAKRVNDKSFIFDRSYGGAKVTQEDLFEGVVRQQIDSLVEENNNATVFAYGATGSGKTYTMLGTPEQPGVTVLAMRHLFQLVGDAKHAAVEVSFLEVYCEQIKDLLADAPGNDEERKPLDVRETKEGVVVPGLTALPVTSPDEVMQKLYEGNLKRTVRSTNSNEVSSRSHAVFQVRLKRRYQQGVKVCVLSMIDLAGSERLKKSEVQGMGQLEATRINQSLLSLGNCITKLASGKGHVPYRDSKLTRLLQESLQGNCRTVMIAAVSPSHKQVEETLNTLKYADRAKNIQTLVKGGKDPKPPPPPRPVHVPPKHVRRDSCVGSDGDEQDDEIPQGMSRGRSFSR